MIAVEVVAALLVVAGLVAWTTQLARGMEVTDSGQSIVWGLYIAAFLFLAGLGCGLVFLAAAGTLGMVAQLAPLTRPLLATALGSLVAAGFVILMDTGKPWRVMGLILRPNARSPFVWDFLGLAVVFLLGLAYWWTAPGSPWLATVAAAVSALVLVTEAWILSVTAARPYWHNVLLPVAFVVDGLLAASAAALIVLGPGAAPYAHLVPALGGLLALSLALTAVEAVAVSYGGDPEARAALRLLAKGSLAPLFWGQIVLGAVLPLALLGVGGPGSPLQVVAAVLAIAGVFAGKLHLLIAGQAHPFMGEPAAYRPSLVEVGGTVGMLALAVLVSAIAWALPG